MISFRSSSVSFSWDFTSMYLKSGSCMALMELIRMGAELPAESHGFVKSTICDQKKKKYAVWWTLLFPCIKGRFRTPSPRNIDICQDVFPTFIIVDRRADVALLFKTIAMK